MLSSFHTNSNLFESTAKSTEYRSDCRGIGSNIPQNDVNGVPDWVQEFRLSAIPDRLTRANAEWIEGQAAIEMLTEEALFQIQRNTSYFSEPAKKILLKYQFAAAGGWVAYGTTLIGDSGTTPYFKPLTPRQVSEARGFGEPKKNKVLKYETPLKMEALPILPYVDPETAQLIYDRYHAQPEDGETFWHVVWRCNLPIAITEGLKKALALIAHGLPAIALRGICNWNVPQTQELRSALRDFSTPRYDIHDGKKSFKQHGRKIFIIFDEDSKPLAAKNTSIQRRKLGKALSSSVAKVFIPRWDMSLGKGIDDVLYGLGDGAALWLKDLLTTAKTLKQSDRAEWKLTAEQRIQALTKLSYPAIRSTQGEYIPDLPNFQPDKTNVLRATVNSGKTFRIGEDWLDQSKREGYFAIVLQPTNSVGHQAATDWDIPHRHDFGDSEEARGLLWTAASVRGGVVMCPESLHVLPDWIYRKKLLLIVDEATQVTRSLCNGTTFNDQSKSLALAQKLTTSASAVILAEDGIDDRAIDFWLTLSGRDKENVVLFDHVKEAAPWPVTTYSGEKSGFHNILCEQIQAGTKIFYATTSQAECARLEQALKQTFPDKIIKRIDSETNQAGKYAAFFDAPNAWCRERRVDILIVSPSVKSGLSIDGGLCAEDSYFGAVFGYFPSLDVESHIQMLGRVRPPVPRFVFCPHYVLNNQTFSPRDFQREVKAVAIASEKFFDVEISSETLPASLLSSAVGRFLAVDRALECLRKSFALDQLITGLKARGHDVADHESLGKNGYWKKLLIKAEEFCDRRTAGLMAKAELTEGEGLSPYINRLYKQREAAALKFSDIDFRADYNCYELLVRERGAMAKGIFRQVRAENLDFNRALDSDEATGLLQQDIQLNHRLPTDAIEAWILGQSGVLELLDGQSYDDDDDRIRRIRSFALRYKWEIARYLRLNMKEDQTGIEIAHKLLKKFDLALRHKHDRPGCIQTVGRFGGRGENSEVFIIDIDPTTLRHEALESARRAALAFVTSTCNDRTSSLQVNVTPTKTADDTPIEDVNLEKEVFEFEYIPSPEERESWGLDDVVA